MMSELKMNIQEFLFFFFLEYFDMKCEKCGGESRINSYNEIWCKDCAMLVYACTCQIR